LIVSLIKIFIALQSTNNMGNTISRKNKEESEELIDEFFILSSEGDSKPIHSFLMFNLPEVVPKPDGELPMIQAWKFDTTTSTNPEYQQYCAWQKWADANKKRIDWLNGKDKCTLSSELVTF
jgi:hypothetical protein